MSVADPAQITTTAPDPGAPLFDADEARHARQERIERTARWALPVIVMRCVSCALEKLSEKTPRTAKQIRFMRLPMRGHYPGQVRRV